MANKPYEVKMLPASYIIKKDATKGLVTAIVSVTGVMDYHGDIIVAGAFKKTISERGLGVKVLNHHNSWSVFDVIGVCLEMREIGREELPEELLQKYPDATGGLLTVTQYLMSTPEGAGAFARIDAGAIDEYSIGFQCMQQEWIQDSDKNTTRYIKEVKLFEYSPVIWGANPATATVGVKAREETLSRLLDATFDTTERAGRALKAGRKISAANAKKLKAAVDGCRGALDSLLTVMQEAGLATDDIVEEEENDTDSKSKPEQAGPPIVAPTSDAPDTTAIDLKAQRDAMLAKVRQAKNAS
jgi:phage head maturation protease